MQRHFLRTLLALVLVFSFLMLLLLAAATQLPALARGPGATLLGQLLHRPVQLDGLRLDPLHLALHIDGLAVGEAPGDGVPAASALPFAQVAHIDLTLAAASLRHGYPIIAALTVDRPQLRLARDVHGRLSVQDLLDRFLTAPSKGPPPDVVLHNLLIKDGDIDWIDDRTRHEHALRGLQFELPTFSTRSADAGQSVEPRLYAKLDGHLLVLFGTARKAKEGEALAAHFEVEDLRLPDYIDLLPLPPGIVLRDGRFDSRLNLHVQLRPGGLPALQLDGRCTLRDVDVAENTAQAPALMRLTEIDVPVQQFDLDARSLHLGPIMINGFSARVTRAADGHVDWLRVIQEIEAARPPDPRAGAAIKPAKANPDARAVKLVTIDGVNFQHGQLAWHDAALATPLSLALNEVKLTMGTLHWPTADQTPVSLDLQGDRGESASIVGTLSTPGPQLSADVQLRHIDLDRVSPYFAGRLPVRVVTSPFDSAARLHAGLDDQGAFARIRDLEFKLPEIQVSERTSGRLLVAASTVQIHALQADSRLGVASAKQFQWSQLRSGFEVGSGPANLSGLTAAWRIGHYAVDGLHIEHLALPGGGGASLLQTDGLQADLPTRKFSLRDLAATDLTTPTGLHVSAVGLGPTHADLESGRYHAEQMSAAELTAPGNNHFAGLILSAADLDLPARHFTLASVHGTGLSLGGRFTFPLLDAVDADVDVGHQQIKLGSLSAHGTQLDVRRTAQGTFSLGTLPDALKAFPAPHPGVANTPGQAGGQTALAAPHKSGLAGWTAQLRLLDFADWSGSFRDETRRQSAELRWSGLQLQLKDVSTVAAQPAQLKLKATLNSATMLDLSGHVRLTPLDGRLDMKLTQLQLPEFLPWLPLTLPVDINTAQLSSTASVQVHGTLDAPSFLYDGTVQLAHVALMEPSSARTVLGWERVEARDVHVNSRPLDAAIGLIEIEGLRAQLALEADGSLNLTRLLGSKSPTAGSSPRLPISAQSRRLPFPLSIGRIELGTSSIDFNDHFIHPEYSAHVTALEGSVSGLSSEQAPPGRIDLAGKLDGGARLQVNGTINPLAQPLFLDVQARVDDFELGPLSSYSSRFTGFPIERGKLSFKVAYRIDQGHITARNALTLDQLTLGPRRDVPGIRQIPMDLAVNLLRNSDGVISVDLPIEGTLSDPQFNLGNVIGQLVSRAAERAVTAPFRWLGGLFESEHAEQLAWIGFTPGSDTLDATAIAKLETLSRALKARPALRLDISARTDPVRDPAGLRTQLFEDTLRVQKIRRMIGAGQAVGGPDSVQWSAEERSALILDAWQQAHPGAAPGGDPARAEAALRAALRTGPDELAALAHQRAQAAQDWLTGPGGLSAARIFVVMGEDPQAAAVRARSESTTPTPPAARIDFTLH